MNKPSLKEELCQLLAKDLEALEQAYRTTLEGATHAEAKPENDKDTRALEQTYLARGQARRVEEARAGLLSVRAMELRPFTEGEPSALGAVVVLDEGIYFLAPYGGGVRLGGKVQVVTPASPLGGALLGRRAGDDVEVQVGKTVRERTVERIF